MFALDRLPTRRQAGSHIPKECRSRVAIFEVSRWAAQETLKLDLEGPSPGKEKGPLPLQRLWTGVRALAARFEAPATLAWLSARAGSTAAVEPLATPPFHRTSNT